MTSDLEARVALAALYRAYERYGWTDLTYTHLGARVPSQPEHYFTNRYGLLFEEVCASNLIEIDREGKVVGSDAAVNRVGVTIHSAVFAARPEINYVLHSHTLAGVAVSTMECGLLPISQHANTVLGTLAYHRFEVIHDSAEDRARIVKDLGSHHLLIMNNHGLLACGRTPGEALLYMYFLERACAIQVASLTSGTTLITPPREVAAELSAWGAPRGEPWGQKQWDALIRALERDDASYRD